MYTIELTLTKEGTEEVKFPLFASFATYCNVMANVCIALGEKLGYKVRASECKKVDG